MTHDVSGWLSVLIVVVFVAALGVALAYGIVHTRRLSARKRQQRDAATRDLYRHPQ